MINGKKAQNIRKRLLVILLLLSMALSGSPAVFAEEGSAEVQAYPEEAVLPEEIESSDVLPEELLQFPETESEEPPVLFEPETTEELLPEEPELLEKLTETAVQDAVPVVVRFVCDALPDLSSLQVRNGNYGIMEPCIDPETAQPLYDCYELLPGAYSYSLAENSGRYEPLSDVPFTVNAEEAEQTITIALVEKDLWGDVLAGIEIQSMTVVNPVYSGLISEEEIPDFELTPERCAVLMGLVPARAAGNRGGSDVFGEIEAFEVESGIYHTSIAEAGAEVKGYVKAREPEIRIHFTSSTRLEWKPLCSQIYAAAVSHTGVPTEGDYLRFEYGGYTAKGSGPILVGDSYTYLFVYTPYYYTTPAQEAEMDAAVYSVLAQLALDGKSDIEKVEAIYRYLCENVSYTSDTSTLRYTGYSALVLGSAVCQGYAVSFYRLCLEVGVYPVRIISSQRMVHAWVIYRVGDYYYMLDPTWDAGASSWKWFLCGSSKWLLEHWTSGYAEIGDQYNDSSFAAMYPLASEDCGKICTITYDANGGTAAPASQIKGENSILTLQSGMPVRADQAEDPYLVRFDANGGSTSAVSLQAKRTTSYSFRYWNTAANGSGTSYNAGGKYSGKTSVTLYAQWRSTTAAEPVLLPAASRLGYYFRGWAETAAASSGLTGYYTPTENITLYAVWEEDPVASFVMRCYSQILEREGDAGGVEFWTNLLKRKQVTGADIVSQFCKSAEFQGRGLANTRVVSILYSAMLNRLPDSGGLNYWVDLLDKGCSCNLIISGFAGSPEFVGICSRYGINAGAVELETRDKNPLVTAFVTRCYRYALNRKGDADGLNGWTGVLLNRSMTPQQLAYNFVFSDECISRNLNDNDFIKMLYLLYMGREADSGGLQYWTGLLRSGTARSAAVNSFASSDEFAAIVKSYGL